MSRLFGLICGIIRFDSCHELIKRHHGALFILRFIDEAVVVTVLRLFDKDRIVNGNDSSDRLAVLSHDNRFVGVRDTGDGISQAITQMKKGNGIEVFQTFLVVVLIYSSLVWGI